MSELLGGGDSSVLTPAPEWSPVFLSDRANQVEVVYDPFVRDAQRAAIDADVAVHQYLTWGDPETGNHLVDVDGVTMLAHKGDFHIGEFAELGGLADAARETLLDARSSLHAQNELNPNGYPWVSAGFRLAGLIASTLQKTDEFAERASGAVDDATARRIVRGVLRWAPRVGVVLAGGLFGAVACGGAANIAPTPSHTLPSPGVDTSVPLTPQLTPENPPTIGEPTLVDSNTQFLEPGGVQPRPEFLHGQAPGFGGAGDAQETLIAAVQPALEKEGLLPVGQEMVNPDQSKRNIASYESGGVTCIAIAPQELYAPDEPGGSSERLGEHNGVVWYGEPGPDGKIGTSDDTVATKVIATASLTGLPDSIACVNAVVTDPENPAGLGAIEMLLVDTNAGNIIGEMPAAFSGDTRVEVLQGAGDQKVLVDGEGLAFTFRPGAVLVESTLTPPPTEAAPLIDVTLDNGERFIIPGVSSMVSIMAEGGAWTSAPIESVLNPVIPETFIGLDNKPKLSSEFLWRGTGEGDSSGNFTTNLLLVVNLTDPWRVSVEGEPTKFFTTIGIKGRDGNWHTSVLFLGNGSDKRIGSSINGVLSPVQLSDVFPLLQPGQVMELSIMRDPRFTQGAPEAFDKAAIAKAFDPWLDQMIDAVNGNAEFPPQNEGVIPAWTLYLP